MRHWPRTDSRFWAGLVLTALLALAVPAAWYVAYDVIWAPSHDDMVSLLLSSEGHNRADLVLSAPTTSRRSAREILGTIAPRPDYGVLDTVLDVYRLSINPPVYLGLLNLWRRIVGGSFPAAMMLSLVFCSMSACALFCVVAWERGWLTGLLFSALYCFSPTYWEAALATRQYALSALLASVLAGSLTWWLRTGQASSLPAAAAFVAVGMLLTLTSYQSSVLVLSLLAGLVAMAILRKDRRIMTRALAAGMAFTIASGPIFLLARWQGQRGGPLGVPVRTLLPFGSPAETMHDALQALLSLFVDIPFAHVPVAGLVIAVLVLLGGLTRLAAEERPMPAVGTLLVVSLTAGCALYAVLVFLKQFPPWFALRYFTAYSSTYLALLALVQARSLVAATIRKIVLGILLAVSSGTFILRTGHYFATSRQEEHFAFQDLRRAQVVLTDARQHAQVLRVAAHASPEADFWLVRLPIDPDSCRAIADDCHGRRVAMVRTGENDRAELESALRACLPPFGDERAFNRNWLDLTIWAP
ncbi:MAG: hypothetical protein AUI47_09940 [Acidobacteria bacterium 13_1_40CM_2_68_5]|nr:MAG: hypothetical protein AUI47_09940 [Acidobacteria bacterium 13_1_40CM_2_68_5]